MQLIMKMNKECILIIAPQFGYNTDWYKFSEILSDSYNVYYLCRKGAGKVVNSNKVHVIYYEATNKNYYLKILSAIRKLKDTVTFKKVFVYAYPTCSFLSFFFKKEQLIMDIRTSYIKSPVLSWICNKLIKIESSVYDKISVISMGVAEFLGLNLNKCYLLPLGGEKKDFINKSLDSLKLIYVGTFYDRHIEKTVEGFASFKKAYPQADVTYSIVGFGSEEDIKLICNKIKENNLEKDVVFLGERRGDGLNKLMEEHNVGVSYIPLTDYYDCQPPTKTYEYLLGSMIVLATPTSENMKVINSSNGVLTKTDSPDAFCEALIYIYDHRRSYNLKEIYDTSLKYNWGSIVNSKLEPLCR